MFKYVFLTFSMLYFLINLTINSANIENLNVLYFDFFPKDVTTLYNGSSYKKTTKCFDITYSLNVNNKNLEFIIDSEHKSSIFCNDYYLFGTNKFLQFHNVILNDKYKYIVNSNFYIAKDIELNGFHIFHFDKGVVYSIGNLLSTYELFNSINMKSKNINFLKTQMGLLLEKSSKTNISFNVSSLSEGDIILITRYDGLDPMIMYGSGSSSGHTAMVLLVNNTLSIVESTDKNPFGKSYWPPPYGIIHTPIERWFTQANDADFSISVIRLRNNILKTLDFKQIRKTFQTFIGLPYGYHNLIYGWIDTINDNFPMNLNSNLFSILVNFLGRYYPNIIQSIIVDGLNKRLQTINKTMEEILYHSLDNNITFNELFTYPELDKWTYSDGRSMVCDVLVLTFGGLIGFLIFNLGCPI